MLQALDALAAWREATVSTLAVSHALSSYVVSDALPSSRLAVKTPGAFVVPVCVPLEIEERVTVEGSGEEDNALLTALVTSLRALSGKVYLTTTARIHSHVLVGETPGVDENKRRQTVLTWRVVASWS